MEYASHAGKTGGGLQVNSFIQLDNSVNRADGNSERLRRIICHELMHTLGMYDLYGAAWNPTLMPTGDLMSGETPTVNPYYKILLGWTEKITLVTSDTLDIRLNRWAESGETILVTDAYNGIFDEFYLIAYAKEQVWWKPQVRIWHVDARLNADKTAFLYDNLTYSPKPGQENGHVNTKGTFPYLFMEEVSAIPYSDNVINWSTGLYFREGSSLGPGSIPSTDTHDGRYTGIKINDFKVFDTYATMDITFGNRDIAAPTVVEKQSVIGFVAENKLAFSEYIYPSDNWDKIQIMTLTGQAIPARIARGHYLVYTIEIVIEGEIPKEGYQIVLPEGCVRDSSGNKNKAVTIPVTPEGKIFEESSVLLPWYYPDRTRTWEQAIHSFSYGNDSILITASGEGDNSCAFIEFLKVGADGEMITHKFIRNPYEGRCELYRVYQANDGSCILRLRVLSDMNTVLLCVDPNGELRWHKKSEEKMQFGHLTDAFVAYENGILFCGQWRTFIDAQTGEIIDTNVRGQGLITVCYNGIHLIGISNGKSILVMDPVTLSVKEKYSFDVQWTSGYYQVGIMYNSNGTYTFVAIGRKSAGITAAILDSSFRVVKQAVFDSAVADNNSLMQHHGLRLYPGDGFVASVCTVAGNHSNENYHIFRVNRSLDLMWETDIETSVTCCFVTASNEICAFSSYWSPARQANLQKFGSEDAFEIVSHTMSHHAARSATCTAEGQIEHWVCTDCGGYFADAEGANAITAASVILPKAAHVPQAYANVAPTCTTAGSTGGTCCKNCSWELTPKTVIPAIGHTPVTDPAVAPTCTADGLSEGSHCSVCRAVLTPQTAVPATGHTVVEDAAVAPTTEREGLTAGSHCGACNTVLTVQQSIPRLGAETNPSPVTTEPPATTASPVTTADPTTAGAPDTMPPTTEAPVQTTGENNIPAPASGKPIPVVIAVVAVVVIAVVVVVMLKKRK